MVGVTGVSPAGCGSLVRAFFSLPLGLEIDPKCRRGEPQHSQKADEEIPRGPLQMQELRRNKRESREKEEQGCGSEIDDHATGPAIVSRVPRSGRSEEHTSELQSRGHLVCRLL